MTPRLLENLPRFLLLTGKGGVGKTSVACAAALELARAGGRILLVSTDPASNIGHVFSLTIGDRITPIPTVPGLDALEIDPKEAAAAYRERILEPIAKLLPAKELEAVTEQLSGSCTTEIASFNEFTGLLADPERTAAYDHVIFDTAPTGHTIRLLSLPGDWTNFLDEGKGDASCLGPMSGLEKNRAMYRGALEALADPERTRLVLVARAQEAALAEVERTAAELADLGIRASHLVINGILPEADDADRLHMAIRSRERAAVEAMPPILSGLRRDEIALRDRSMVGVSALETFFSPEDEGGAAPASAIGTRPSDGKQAPAGLPDGARSLADLVDEIDASGHGLVMTMGKGGVGKTTIAAAIARALAARGRRVHLTTTDPAAHLAGALGDGVDGLIVDAVDPEAATQEYRAHVMETKGAALDEAGRAALAEDLLSPCTEEIAVFGRFSDIVAEAEDSFVVMDTAPTGHTLLLMDATGSYHRDVVRHMTADDPARSLTPLTRLQDPEYTKIVVVTLPETTPVLEAEELVADLERADIQAWAWVIDQSLAAAAPDSALLARRAEGELPLIERVAGRAERLAIIPALDTEPRGARRLLALSARAGAPE